MVCPRCSLHNPKGTLACARCGEVTPRPVDAVVDTKPPVEGPRASLAKDVPVDRRGRGVRTVGQQPPGGVRMRAAARLRARNDEIERRARLRPGDVEGNAALDSAIHQARTEPHWHKPPAETERSTDPGPLVALAQRHLDDAEPDLGGAGFLPPPVPSTPPVSSDVLPRAVSRGRRADPPAPIGLRAAAAFVDLLVVAATVAAAFVGGAFLFGVDALEPHLARGVDAVIDGLFFGRGLATHALVLAVVVAYVYETASLALAGASFGKQLLGLRVETRTGHRPDLSTAAVRTAASFLLTVPAGLTWFAALFDGQVRALHDRIVGTRVVLLPDMSDVSNPG